MERILLVAGGGGHTGHAYIFSQFLKRYFKLSFIIPRGDTYSRIKLRDLGEIYEAVKPFQPTEPYTTNIYKIVEAFIDVLHIPIQEYKLVICFGSNHCIAPIIYARIKGVKTLLVESPMRIVSQSRAYKYLKYFADYIFVSWNEQLKYYPPEKTVVIGPYYEKAKHPPRNEGYILVLTGTHGFPELVEEILKLPLEKAVIQTGRDDPEKYRRRKPEWVFFDYDPDLGRWISGAEIVVSHLGRTIIDSIYTYCKPVVIVPNPRWIRGVTIKDAVELARKTRSIITVADKLGIEHIEKAIKNKPYIEELCTNTINGAEKASEIILRITG